MGNHIRNGIIVSEKKIDQAQRRRKDKPTNRNPRLPRTFDEQRMPRNNGGDATHERVHRAHKRKNQRERAKYIHAVPASPDMLSVSSQRLPRIYIELR